MKSRKVPWIYLVLIALLPGCSKDSPKPCFTSRGAMVTESRKVGEFHTINLSGRIDVVLKTDSFYGVSVTAGAHLQNGLETRVENGQLIISNHARCNWLRRMDFTPTVEVITPDLQGITYTGSGNITCSDTLHTPVFSLVCDHSVGSVSLLLDVDSVSALLYTGYSDLTLAGKAVIAGLYTSDATRVNALALDVGYCFINSNSIADDYVHFRHYLYAQTGNSGNIFFIGPDSAVDRAVYGSGGIYPY